LVQAVLLVLLVLVQTEQMVQILYLAQLHQQVAVVVLTVEQHLAEALVAVLGSQVQ
jgi:hypothetical protein